MASAEQIASLRRMIDDPAGSTQTYSDLALSALIDQAEGVLEAAASELWQEKAATFSRLVNVSESGSSRSMGDLYKNALAMAKYYKDQVTTTIEVETTQRARVRPIVRP